MGGPTTHKQLRVAVVGGGLGGLAAAVSLRRAGHLVDIYERRDFGADLGSSIAFAANGTRWLYDWEVDIPSMKPIFLSALTVREWGTGNIISQNSLEDYEQKWGYAFHNFHRQDIHAGLLTAATSPEGKGTPATLHMDYECQSVDWTSNSVTFINGETITADLIVGADGRRSVVRTDIGITPAIEPAPQTCYRSNIFSKDLKRLGLVEWAADPAMQFWGGTPGEDGRSRYYKVVTSPCRGGEIISLYCLMPTELTKHHEDGFIFEEVPVDEVLREFYDKLHPNCRDLIRHSWGCTPWRMYLHDTYDYWYKENVCLLGDAAHPMLPQHGQGAVQAIEDAAALGIIFSDQYNFTQNIKAGLALYEAIRKPRATRIQNAAVVGATGGAKRAGPLSSTPNDRPQATTEARLPPEELAGYKMKEHIASEVQKLGLDKE